MKTFNFEKNAIALVKNVLNDNRLSFEKETNGNHVIIKTYSGDKHADVQFFFSPIDFVIEYKQYDMSLVTYCGSYEFSTFSQIIEEIENALEMLENYESKC